MKNEENLYIRQYMKQKRVFSYEVADYLGISAPAFSAMLRNELSQRSIDKLTSIIDEIAAIKKPQIDAEREKKELAKKQKEEALLLKRREKVISALSKIGMYSMFKDAIDFACENKCGVNTCDGCELKDVKVLL